MLASPLLYVAQTGIVTKCYAATILVLSLFHAYLRFTTPEPSTPYLTLVPGRSIWYPWTFLTAGLLETSFLELTLSLVLLPPTLRYFERLWGAVETAKFIVIVTTISNIIAFFANWAEYFVTGYAELFLYGQQYAGQTALQAGILVAFTQVIPEHQLQLFSSLKVRVKHLPMHYVTFSTVLCLLGFQAPFILIQFGWLVSWTYLRFYKRTSSDVPGGIETYGDRSEAFAFVHWFPSFLHYPIGLASDVAYGFALRMRLVKPFPSSAGDLEGGYHLAPGGARAEAERRRALALKALDQRLAHNQSSGSSGPAGPIGDTPTPTRPSPVAVAASTMGVPSSTDIPHSQNTES